MVKIINAFYLDGAKKIYLSICFSDSDHPFMLENGDPFDLRPFDAPTDSRNNFYSSIVRNVPIRVEGRKDSNNGDSSTNGVGGRASDPLSLSARKSPPPPPQRRHFYRSSPYLSSSSLSNNLTATSSEDEKLSDRIGVDDVAPVKFTNNDQKTKFFSTYDSPSSVRTTTHSPSLGGLKSNNFDPIYSRTTNYAGIKSILTDDERRSKDNGQQQQHVRFADTSSASSPIRLMTTLNNSVGSDNGTSSDRSSSLSDSTASGRLSNASGGGNDSYDVPSSLRVTVNPPSSSTTAMTMTTTTTNGTAGGGKTSTLYNLTSNLFNNAVGETLYDSPKNNSPAIVTSMYVTNDVTPSKINTISHSTNVKNATAVDLNGVGGLYDVLSRNRPTAASTNGKNGGGVVDFDRVSVSSADSDYQELKNGSPSTYTSSNAALQRLLSVQQNLHVTTSKLNNFVSKNWRSKEFLESHLYDIRLTCRHVVSTLKDYIDFCSGCFVNLTHNRNVDGSLVKKFAHFLRPLRQSLTYLSQLQQSLESSGWMVSKFVRDSSGGNDNLDQFVAVSKQIPEDSRPVSTFVKSNAAAMFDAAVVVVVDNGAKRNNVPTTLNGDGVLQEDELMDNSSADEKGSLFDDYDFVDGPTSSTTKTNQNGITNGHHNHVTNVGSISTNDAVPSSSSSSLQTEDKQILTFYCPQIDSHMECLSNAIDDFLAAVERNEPPKVFVGHSRFVILAAHKLVYIGDSLSHCLKNRDVADKMKDSSDRLCDVLKYCVTATKQASLQYPAVASVQAMVDSMVNVSHVAHELKLFVRQAASM